MVVLDDLLGAQVRAMAQRVPVRNYGNLEAEGHRRADGSVHAEVRGPARNEHTIGLDLPEIRLEGGAEEGIVQGLADDAIAFISDDRLEEMPPCGEGCEVLTRQAIVLDEMDGAFGSPYSRSQAIDALNDTRKIMLGSTSQEAPLHVDHDESVHEPFRQSALSPDGPGARPPATTCPQAVDARMPSAYHRPRSAEARGPHGPRWHYPSLLVLRWVGRPSPNRIQEIESWSQE